MFSQHHSSEQPGEPAPADGARAARPRQLISIRASLLTTLLGLVAAITLALLIGLAVSTVRLVRRMSGTIITACSSQVEAQLAAYFGPAETLLDTAASLAAAGLLDPADTEAMNRWLWPLCRHMPQIGALRTCDAAGNCYALVHRGGEWLNAEVRPTQWPGQVQWTARDWPGGPPLRQWQEALPEDWRSAHWYTGALAADPGSVHWTEPYHFQTAQDPGISASMQFQVPGRPSFVLAVDLLVSDLDDFTDSLRPTPFGYVVLTNSAGRLLESTTGTEEQESSSAEQTPAADPATVRPPIENDRELMQSALSTWDKLQDRKSLGAGIPATGEGSILAASQEHETFRFYRSGERWWGGLQPIALGGEAKLMLAVLLPESDLLGEAQRQRNMLLIVALIELVAATGLAFALAHSYSAPITALARQSERLRMLDLQCCTDEETRSRLLEVVQLSRAHASMRSALDSFSRYVPTELVRELLHRGEAARIGGHTLRLTVLITDIRGFTALCEELPPEKLAAQLTEYFECLLTVLNTGGATIDKLIGDSVVCFWGAPQPDELQAQHAVATMLRAAEALDQLNARWAAEGRPQMLTKAGIAMGDVVVGNIGARWRLNYTALGDAVNLASRLEKINPDYGAQIIVSAAAQQACVEEFAWRTLGRVAVRGRQAEEDIYEPLSRVKPGAPGAS